MTIPLGNSFAWLLAIEHENGQAFASCVQPDGRKLPRIPLTAEQADTCTRALALGRVRINLRWFA